MKKLLVFSIGLLLFASCEQDTVVSENEEVNADLTRGVKVNICHKGRIKRVSVNALGGHQGHGDAVDMDGDGYFDIESNCSAIDCDDTNALVNPDSTEIPYNGIDDDCDPLTLDDDLDEDGFNNDEDCDDTNPDVNPGMEEICDNGIDDNCDGEIDENCEPELQIGDFVDGGIVFYIAPAPTDLDGDGILDSGLVCSLNDTTAQWGCFGTDLLSVPNVNNNPPSGPGAEIGDGMTNTNGILSDCLTTTAAGAARLLGPEWFLPSINELNQMYLNRVSINTAATANGGDALGTQYWSSTETSGLGALVQNFANGTQFNSRKRVTDGVRPVKAF